jgi:CTP:molybdopterin cytidylyltransferase MocA
MPVARDYRSGTQADIMDRATKILRTIIAIASGRHGVSRRGRRHRHGTTISHRQLDEHREAAGRRAWLVKQETSVWRLGILVCALVALGWVAWRITAQTAAQSLAESHPDVALSWVADQPTALNQRVRQELTKLDGNLDLAREWAQRALRSNPLNVRALTLLGLIAERKGDQKSADALMRISGARTWSDRTSQAWLLNRAVRSGNYLDAISHVDAILRMEGYSSQTPLYPMLAGFTADPQAFKALTTLLAESPPWRTWFLSELSARLPNQTRLIQLYAALNETENPPTKKELWPYLNRLIKDQNFEQAHQAWHETLSPEQRADKTYPFNGDFGIAVDGLPFNWNLEASPGAHVQIVTSVDGGKKRALYVEFSGGRASFANVKQLMMLPSGDYTFRGSVKTKELRTSRGLWWHIFCANNSTRTLAHTELVSGTKPWTDFTVKFEVPATDCRAQWLRLELPARVASESRIEGQVWYQDLRIARIPPLGPASLDH